MAVPRGRSSEARPDARATFRVRLERALRGILQGRSFTAALREATRGAARVRGSDGLPPADADAAASPRAAGGIDRDGMRLAHALHGLVCALPAYARMKGAELEPRDAFSLVQRHGKTLREDPERGRELAARVPAWAWSCLQERFGERAREMALALAEPPPRTLRVTRRAPAVKAAASALLAAGMEGGRPGRWAERALVYPPWSPHQDTAPHHEGLVEAQDEASQIVCELVAPPPRGRVLDLCAGAGGKTVALADVLEGKGEVLATDPSEARLEACRRRARRLGLSQVRAVRLEEEEWPQPVRDFAARADRILVDAPCSGLGAWRRRPELRLRLGEAELPRLEALQRDLVGRALALLRPGARLIYATCTFRAEENEAVVAEALAADPQLELVPLRELLGRERAERLGSLEVLRLDPLTHGTDGFFAAVLRRRRS